MVTFNDNSFSITVKTGLNPIEDWLGLQNELLSILSTINAEDIIEHWRTIGLLQDMLPDHNLAIKMHPLKEIKK